ncbi:hypothetical protein Cni_G22410 [Canna indica]|uniref:Uncharacterized protein n=1 Tax=Canna indica TaxID=4628 RepID=A0AAQ3KXW6_9LILI|nr:hypothetical protein Cni_G22410 [Canna indica]
MVLEYSTHLGGDLLYCAIIVWLSVISIVIFSNVEGYPSRSRSKHSKVRSLVNVQAKEMEGCRVDLIKIRINLLNLILLKWAESEYAHWVWRAGQASGPSRPSADNGTMRSTHGANVVAAQILEQKMLNLKISFEQFQFRVDQIK